MTTTTASVAQTSTGLGAILLTMALGGALLFTTGFANPAALHAAAHDARHAVAFPCH